MGIRGTTLNFETPRSSDIAESDTLNIAQSISGFYKDVEKLRDIGFEDRGEYLDAVCELVRTRLAPALGDPMEQEGLHSKMIARAFRSVVYPIGQDGVLPIEYRLRYLDLEMRQFLIRSAVSKPAFSSEDAALLGYLRHHSLAEISWNEIESAAVRTAIREALGELVAIRISQVDHTNGTSLISGKEAAQRLSERVREVLSSSISQDVRCDLEVLTSCLSEQLNGAAPTALDLLRAITPLSKDLRFTGNLVGQYREGQVKTSLGEPLQIIHMSSNVPDSILVQAAELSKRLAIDPDKTGPQKGLSRSYSEETLREYADNGAIFTFVMQGDLVRGMGISLPKRGAIAADTQELMQNTGFSDGKSLYVRSVGIEDSATWPQAPKEKYECLIEAISDWALAHGKTSLCGQVRLDNTAMTSHHRVGFKERGGNKEIEIDANGIRRFVFQAVERDTAEMIRRVSVERLPIKCSWE